MAPKELPPRVKESIAETKATYKQLGKSGLRVSVPIFGAMSFGSNDWASWVIEEDKVGFRDCIPCVSPGRLNCTLLT
jgi:hypothetical protein